MKLGDLMCRAAEGLLTSQSWIFDAGLSSLEEDTEESMICSATGSQLLQTRRHETISFLLN